MDIPFYKYQGTGNDFVVIDNREGSFLTRKDHEIIEKICDRRFGVGADGLMLLQHKEGYDFEMVYFNADGYEGSMCGNGGRCIVAFAHFLGVIGETCRFIAVDGPHDARVISSRWVELKMVDVESVEKGKDFYFLDTGSPHYVSFSSDVEALDVVREGKSIRYSDRFKEEGTNVNFVQPKGDELIVATYERGVEDETLSCGTGVTAAALADFLRGEEVKGEEVKGGVVKGREIGIRAKGGELKVKFAYNNNTFEDIWLCGPATQVFQGEITIDI